jgi:predicted RNA-binding Zn-ribbon protein involved in translation (DUF1610 family)
MEIVKISKKKCFSCKSKINHLVKEGEYKVCEEYLKCPICGSTEIGKDKKYIIGN